MLQHLSWVRNDRGEPFHGGLSPVLREPGNRVRCARPGGVPRAGDDGPEAATMEQPETASVEEALEAFRLGRMVILVDDEDRENEGDLAIAAE